MCLNENFLSPWHRSIELFKVIWCNLSPYFLWNYFSTLQLMFHALFNAGSSSDFKGFQLDWVRCLARPLFEFFDDLIFMPSLYSLCRSSYKKIKRWRDFFMIFKINSLLFLAPLNKNNQEFWDCTRFKENSN